MVYGLILRRKIKPSGHTACGLRTRPGDCSINFDNKFYKTTDDNLSKQWQFGRCKFLKCPINTVWPDVGVKSRAIFSKSCTKCSPMQFSHESEVFQNSPKSCQSFGLLLVEILLPRTLKNDPFCHTESIFTEIWRAIINRDTLYSIHLQACMKSNQIG